LTTGVLAAMPTRGHGDRDQSVVGYADLQRWVAVRNEVAPDNPDDPGMMASFALQASSSTSTCWSTRTANLSVPACSSADPNSIASSHP
jgi:hypothetical protein